LIKPTREDELGPTLIPKLRHLITSFSVAAVSCLHLKYLLGTDKFRIYIWATLGGVSKAIYEKLSVDQKRQTHIEDNSDEIFFLQG